MSFVEPPDALLDARDSDEGRAVLADWLEEHGWSSRLARKRSHTATTADADADTAAADAAAAADQPTLKLRREEIMRDGFKILQFRSRYNYLATFAGWVRHVRGDHYEMTNFRAVVRKSGYAWDGLMRLASEGPSKDYTLTDMSAPGVSREFIETESVNVHACIAASWVQHCPRPEGWES